MSDFICVIYLPRPCTEVNSNGSSGRSCVGDDMIDESFSIRYRSKTVEVRGEACMRVRRTRLGITGGGKQPAHSGDSSGRQRHRKTSSQMSPCFKRAVRELSSEKQERAACSGF